MQTLHAAIREFTQAIVNPFDLDDLLDRLVRHATDVLDAAGAGIMLQDRHGRLDFASASSGTITEAERHQDHVGSGACHEAFCSNRTIVVADLELAGRWPTYTPKVLALGLRAVIGVPLNAQGETIGVLNVYRSTPTPWTEDDVEACEILAAMGAGYVLHANQLVASQRLTDQLHEALDSRMVIERAKGILMAKHDIDADTAFEELRRASMDSNRKLRDVARETVQQQVAD